MKRIILLAFVLTACAESTAPKEDLKANLVVACDKLNCVISATGSTPYNSITNFRIDYGDGQMSWNAPLGRHIYDKAGDYIVDLVVIDRNGNVAETYKRLSIGGGI